MGEGDSTAAVRSLEPSISFGRFENDLLSWEKWSAFSQNKYLEEVEKCATPGSVAQKKAFFEARNVLIAMRKSEILNTQMEAVQELSQETEIQDCGSEINRYDEEHVDKKVFENELRSPDICEHPELETDVNGSHEPGEEDVMEHIPADRCVTDQATRETISRSQSSCHIPIDHPNNGVMFESKSEMYSDSPDENTYGGTLEIKEQQEQISKTEHNGCAIDQPSNMKICVIRPAKAIEETKVGCFSEMDSNFDIYIDAPHSGKQETILKSEYSPSMIDQLKLDLPSKSTSTMEGDNVKSEDIVDIPALEQKMTALDPEYDGMLPNNSKDKSAQTQKMKVNPQKSSKKIRLVRTQNSVEYVKKTQISSDPRSSQMTTPKISKPSMPIVKSASRSLPVSRVKNTAASTTRKSREFLNTTVSTPRPTTPSTKPAFLSPSKKGLDSLPPKIKSISAGVSRKPTPTDLHMSLNFGPGISGSVSGSTPVNEPRKSLFMEKMGDKDIVKRAFKAFENMSISLNSVSDDPKATSKQVVKIKTDMKPSTAILQEDKERLAKRDLNEKSRRGASNSKTEKLALQSKEDKRMEVKRVTEKTDLKEATKFSFQSKHKEFTETHIGVRRQSLTYSNV